MKVKRRIFDRLAAIAEEWGIVGCVIFLYYIGMIIVSLWIAISEAPSYVYDG